MSYLFITDDTPFESWKEARAYAIEKDAKQIVAFEAKTLEWKDTISREQAISACRCECCGPTYTFYCPEWLEESDSDSDEAN
jgi:hypothetical protein